MKTTRVPLLAAIFGTWLLILPQGRADIPLGDKLGTIHFDVSGQPEAQAHVVRGVKLVHHMMYPEADREFAQAAALDPRCPLAYRVAR